MTEKKSKVKVMPPGCPFVFHLLPDIDGFYS